MKIVTTGIHGNVGKALIKAGCEPLDIKFFTTASKKRDTLRSRTESIRRVLEIASPDIVINTASKSKPAWCEKEENRAEAIAVNVAGAYNLAEACKELGIKVVALSTDQIFRGNKLFGAYDEKYYRIKPVNFYGDTKFNMEILLDGAGMEHVKIVRTSNLFHKDDPRITWYLDKLYTDKKVPVPTFQKRSFMHIDHFVQSLLEYCKRFDNMPKILHISGSKIVSWYDFMQAFTEILDIPLRHKLVKKYFEDSRFVPRPKRAGLDVSLSAGLGLPQFDYLDGIKIL